MKGLSIFAEFNAKEHFYSLNVVIAIFVAIGCVSAKIRGCSNHCGLWHLCDNLFFGENVRRTAFFMSIYFIFHYTMPKNNENASIVNNSSDLARIAHETGTLLTTDNIERILRMFQTPEDYQQHVGSLWVFRKLIYERIEQTGKTDPMFALFNTVNFLIDAFLLQHVYFEENGQAYTFDKNNVKQLLVKTN